MSSKTVDPATKNKRTYKQTKKHRTLEEAINDKYQQIELLIYGVGLILKHGFNYRHYLIKIYCKLYLICLMRGEA